MVLLFVFFFFFIRISIDLLGIIFIGMLFSKDSVVLGKIFLVVENLILLVENKSGIVRFGVLIFKNILSCVWVGCSLILEIFMV